MKTAKQKLMSLVMAGVLAGAAVLSSHGSAGAALKPDNTQLTTIADRPVQLLPAALLAAGVAVIGFIAKELYDEGQEQGYADEVTRQKNAPVYTNKLRHGRGVASLAGEGAAPVYAALLD